MTERRNYIWLWVLALWAIILPRILPSIDSDRGIWVSVAERLIAGDRLYTDVWDNKEPIFYYLVALERKIGGSFGAAIIELALLCLVCISCYIFFKRETYRSNAFLVSGLITPLIMSGYFYLPGYTHLPGAALGFMSIAAFTSEAYFIGGGILALIFFTKIIFFPVFLIAWVIILHFFSEKEGRWKASCIGICAVFIFMIGVLFTRDELSGFIKTLWLNVHYSQGPLVPGSGLLEKISGHLELVINGRSITIILACAVCLIFAWSKKDNYREAAIASVTFIMSLLILSITGFWEHHDQILYIPAVLSISALISSGALSAPSDSTILTLLLPILLSGWIDASIPIRNWRNAANLLIESEAYSPETSDLINTASPGTYARLGSNMAEEGHARGLKNWKLACPIFHQYSFYPQEMYDEILRCLPGVQRIIVANEFKPVSDDKVPWNSFVMRAEEIIKDRFVCEVKASSRICIIKD